MFKSSSCFSGACYASVLDWQQQRVLAAVEEAKIRHFAYSLFFWKFNAWQQ